MTGIAIVGASPNSPLVHDLIRNLRAHGSPEIFPVNPRHKTMFGLPAFESIETIGQPFDAFIAVTPAPTVPGIVAAAAKLGCTRGAVISASFAEAGTERGRELQQQLVEAAGDKIEIYGPNCIGFADMADGLCAIAEPVPPGLSRGPVSIVSQSGGLTSAIMASLLDDGVGVDWCVSIGNGASVDVAHAIDHAVSRPGTRVVCVYAEELRPHGDRLVAALQKARDRGVGIIMLHPGTSSKARLLVQSHTASVAGDDVLISAFCRAHGVVRVTSVEQLARAAAIWARHGAKAQGGIAVVGGAGGASVLSTDLAAQTGLELPTFSAPTLAKLRAGAGEGSFIENPLDLVRPSVQRSELYGPVFDDPEIDMVLDVVPVTMPDSDELGAAANHRDSIDMVVSLSEATGKPAVVCSTATGPWTGWAENYRREHPQVPFFRGLQLTMQALGALAAASTRTRSPSAPDRALRPFQPNDTLVTEIAGRREFTRLGIPVVPGADARTTAELAPLLNGLNYPVVVKADVRGAAHKGDLSAIELGCADPDQALAAAEQIVARLHAGNLDHSIEGILAEEQVAGREVLVGLTRTALGGFLTVVPGGVGTTTGDRLRTVALPVADDIINVLVAAAVPELPADASGLIAAIEIIRKMAGEFISGGLRNYVRVEVNPLMVGDDSAAIADILMEQG